MILFIVSYFSENVNYYNKKIKYVWSVKNGDDMGFG